MTGVGSERPTSGETGRIIPLRERDWHLLDGLLAIDSRGLAAVRIGLGFVVLIEALFVDQVRAVEGTGPLAFLLRHADFIVVPFAVQLILGYRTRLATALVWLLYSAGIRHNLLTQGDVLAGNYILALGLFWGFFLPWGRNWSIDARRGNGNRSMRVLSAASAGLLIQIFLIYFSAGITKNLDEWITNATALTTILTQTSFASDLGSAFAENAPELLSIASIATVLLEIVGPVLLFVPGKALGRRRILLVAAFIALHVGMMLLMDLDTFPFVMMLILLAFLPSSVWERIDSIVFNRSSDTSLAVDQSRWANLVASAALAYIVVSNLITWFYYPSETGLLAAWQQFGKYWLLYQQWAMFSLPSSLA